MRKREKHCVLPAASADREAACAVDALLQRLIVIVEQEGAEEVLDVLLEYVRAPDPKERT